MRRFQPAARPRHVLLALHGAISHAGWFERLGVALLAHDVELWALDRRGSGEARGEAGRDDGRLIVEDVTRAAEEARQLAPVSLLGWCWGARPAVLAAAQLGPAKLGRLVLAAPGLAMQESVRARADAALAGPGDELTLPFDDEHFSEDPEVLAFITSDPLRWRTQPRPFFVTSRQLAQAALAALPALAVPTLTLLASNDRVVDNVRTRALLAGREVHELAGGHALVLEQPEAMAAEIAAWLDAQSH